MRAQVFVKWLYILLLLLLALMLVVQAVVSSNYFNQRLLNALSEQVLELNIRQIDGNLGETLRIGSLEYQSDTFSVQLTDLQLTVSWREIMHGKLVIAALSCNELAIHTLANSKDDKAVQEEPIAVLPLAVAVDGLRIKTMRWVQDDEAFIIEDITSAFSIVNKELAINSLQLHYEQLRAKVSAHVLLQKNFPLLANANVSGTLPGDIPLKTNLQLSGDMLQIKAQQQVIQPAALQLSAFVNVKTEMQYQLRANWQTLQWPLQGKAEYLMEQGMLQLKGTLQDYRLDVQTQFTGMGMASGQLSVKANGDSNGFKRTALGFDNGSGSLQAQGSIDWENTFAWDADIQIQNVQLQQWLDLPNATISANGSINGSTKNGLYYALDVPDITGRINNHVIKAAGQIKSRQQQYHIEALQLQIGNNSLDVAGQVGDVNDLRVNVQAAQLHQIDPRLSGQLNAQLQWRGDWQQPNLQLQTTVNNLIVNNLTLANGSLQADYNNNTEKTITAKLQAEDISVSGQSIDSLSVSLSGAEEAHALKMQMNSSMGNISLAAKGGLFKERTAWQGKVIDLTVKHPEFSIWRLQQTTSLELAQHKPQWLLKLTPLCLQQANDVAHVCVKSASNKLGGQMWEGDIKDFPLAWLNQQLPEAVNLQGRVSANLIMQQADRLSGRLAIKSNDAVMYYHDQDNDENFPLLAQAQLDFTENALSGQFQFSAESLAELQADLQMQNWQQPDQASIVAAIKAQIPDLALLQPYFKHIEQLNGELALTAKVNGNVDQPQVHELQGGIKHGGFYVPETATDISNINVLLDSKDQNKITINGHAEMSGQAMTLEGYLDKTEFSELKLKLRGEDLPVAKSKDLQVTITPNINILLSGTGLQINGDIIVPEADITVAKLPESAVIISEDEVLIPQQQKVTTTPIAGLDIDLNVIIKDAVKITGYGLSTNLSGNLKAVYQQGRIQVFNELSLLNGVYQSYGQDLTIEKGRILFTGNIEDPGIYILAYRKAIDKDDNVKAYLKITGTLHDPKSIVYTQPALPESEALSYLITGGPLDKSAGSNSALLAKAAMYFGKDYLDGVVGAVGIEEFDFKSTDVGEASLILGKKITPKLYIRYILDVITAQMVFAVEYRFNEHFSIEARSGDTHSSDIKYNLEFD